MIRPELVAKLAERFSQLVHRDAEFAVTTILDAMTDALDAIVHERMRARAYCELATDKGMGRR